jgi:hypothetical protein
VGRLVQLVVDEEHLSTFAPLQLQSPAFHHRARSLKGVSAGIPDQDQIPHCLPACLPAWPCLYFTLSCPRALLPMKKVTPSPQGPILSYLVLHSRPPPPSPSPAVQLHSALESNTSNQVLSLSLVLVTLPFCLPLSIDTLSPLQRSLSQSNPTPMHSQKGKGRPS